MKALTVEEPQTDSAPAVGGENASAKWEPEIDEAPTAGAALIGLFRHPTRNLLCLWNWKSAVLSSSFRACIFFFTNLAAGWHAALGALLAELMLRAATSGFYGAITEAFSEARPEWAGMAVAMIVLPLTNHSLEFLVHWLRGTPKLAASITASVIFTAFSTSFNVYAMRHGVLTVGGKSKSLGEDMRQVLPLFGEFMLTGPRYLIRLLGIGNNLS
ncbi:MAG TPA: hypothetical protein VGI34_03745 [Candidatus Acidoferrales bacterium]|jgi:hypothetical protein